MFMLMNHVDWLFTDMPYDLLSFIYVKMNDVLWEEKYLMGFIYTHI